MGLIPLFPRFLRLPSQGLPTIYRDLVHFYIAILATRGLVLKYDYQTNIAYRILVILMRDLDHNIR